RARRPRGGCAVRAGSSPQSIARIARARHLRAGAQPMADAGTDVLSPAGRSGVVVVVVTGRPAPVVVVRGRGVGGRRGVVVAGVVAGGSSSRENVPGGDGTSVPGTGSIRPPPDP